ncbi:LacI family DNA-binding transcriptional regulator [Paenibacillus agaridevorans]|uniref:LacI family DNA-binding transcriptional regulator n=1 Tax=Paenibacillus agaridevorans TaxID=171404 RepID=UPI001BE4DD74|nr:LacI family DNA-binding transcriptional regulator [Paenibacillus agaridevorans]
MMMTVRKKDIADYLGVSRATVSMAFNNSPSSTISEETRARILQAAKELGYKDTNLNSNIAFIIYNRPSNDPRYLHDLKVIERSVREYHYHLLFMNISSHPSEKLSLLQFIKTSEPKGLIITGDLDHEIISMIKSAGVPYVIYGGPIMEEEFNILPDHKKGAYEAVKYLIKLGHKRIALFNGSLDFEVHRLAVDGYIQALEEHGLQIDKTLIQISKEEDGYEICGRMTALNIEYSAAYCANTVIQFGVLQRLKEDKIQVPLEKSLIGYGYTDLNHISVPALTSIYVDWLEKDKVVSQLIKVINNPNRAKEILYLSEMKLFEGETVSLLIKPSLS